MADWKTVCHILFSLFSGIRHRITYMILSERRERAMNTFPLCELKRGETGIIWEILCPPEQTSQKAALVLRLLDLGFCENTPVTCVNLGIFKNPHAYLIRGSVIALRNQDAQMILIEKAPQNHVCSKELL